MMKKVLKSMDYFLINGLIPKVKNKIGKIMNEELFKFIHLNLTFIEFKREI